MEKLYRSFEKMGLDCPLGLDYMILIGGNEEVIKKLESLAMDKYDEEKDFQYRMSPTVFTDKDIQEHRETYFGDTMMEVVEKKVDEEMLKKILDMKYYKDL